MTRIREFASTYIDPYQGISSKKPNDIPLQKIVYNVNVKPKDIYALSSSFVRGNAISNRLKEVFNDYNLPGHTEFEGIKYYYKNKNLRNDFNYLFIYESVYDKIDLSRSTFYSYNYSDNIEVRKSGIKSEKIIDRNLKFKTKEEVKSYDTKLEKLYNQKLWFQSLVIACEIEYDIVTLYNLANRYWMISERLLDKMQKLKLTGFDFIEFPVNIKFRSDAG
ncbi:hypothetical protein [Portibacter marinus]|uniref:hypothetical protein n=1 Tax=Portibacter marinus TaxID=2898660 RepID=UPI001F3D04FF|nr:hypothetical protein [Portibacter marinus]